MLAGNSGRHNRALGRSGVSYCLMEQPSPSHRYRALVIDDDAFVRSFVRHVLEKQGFEVYVAQDGRAAASIYNEHTDFSLIVTDILMPTVDGIDFILKIRRAAAPRLRQPKIIAISGGGAIDAELYLEDAKGLGADETLKKPFSVIDLIEALSRLGFESLSQ
jgi:CheY-like chemotaxis protein